MGHEDRTGWRKPSNCWKDQLAMDEKPERESLFQGWWKLQSNGYWLEEGKLKEKEWWLCETSGKMERGQNKEQVEEMSGCSWGYKWCSVAYSIRHTVLHSKAGTRTVEELANKILWLPWNWVTIRQGHNKEATYTYLPLQVYLRYFFYVSQVSISCLTFWEVLLILPSVRWEVYSHVCIAVFTYELQTIRVGCVLTYWKYSVCLDKGWRWVERAAGRTDYTASWSRS